jgi:hypothetical protein
MDTAQIVQLFVCLFVLPFVVLPAVGGGALSYGFRMAKLPALEVFRGWKIYLASSCYGFLLLIPAGLLMRESGMSEFSKQAIQVAVFCGTQIVLVPILIRNFTSKALGVTTAAVLLTNAAGYMFFVLQRA